MRPIFCPFSKIITPTPINMAGQNSCLVSNGILINSGMRKLPPIKIMMYPPILFPFFEIVTRPIATNNSCQLKNHVKYFIGNIM